MRKQRLLFLIKAPYLTAAAIIFATEVAIALWVHDAFVRPYVGDFLVSILIYCFFRGLFAGSRRLWIATTLVICYGVEILQAFNLVQLLGLGDNRLAKIVIGTYFHPGDLLAYALGLIAVLGVEQAWKTKSGREKKEPDPFSRYV